MASSASAARHVMAVAPGTSSGSGSSTIQTGARNLRPRSVVSNGAGGTSKRVVAPPVVATAKGKVNPIPLATVPEELHGGVTIKIEKPAAVVTSSSKRVVAPRTAKPKGRSLATVPEEPPAINIKSEVRRRPNAKQQDQPQPIKIKRESETVLPKIAAAPAQVPVNEPSASVVPMPIRMIKVEAKGTVDRAIMCSDSEQDDYDEQMQAAMKESAAMSQASSSSAMRTIPPPPVNPYSGARNPRRTSLEVMTEQLQILLTFEQTTCSFCTIALNVGEGIVLQDCFHAFCRNCLTTVLDMSETAEILCPLNEQCGGRVFEREVKALLTPEKFERFLNRSVAQAMGSMQNIFHCKFPNCDGVCIFEMGNRVFLCPTCNNSNCIPCQAIHEGLDCQQYQDLIKTATNLEEAQALVANKAANGWEQMVGTVAGWVSNPSRKRGANRKSLAGSGNILSKVFEQMAALEVVPNTQPFDCTICFDTIAPGDGIILQECFHMCCKDCCVALIQNSDEPNVKCPYQDGNYSCVYYLQPREIRALVSPELYEKHLERSVKRAESAMGNTFHCKTMDCRGWCEFEEGAQFFTCPSCQKKNCLACEVIHEGKSCEDYKNGLVQGENDRLSSEALEELLKQGKAMRCPQCKAVVEKIIGCDWIVCSCKTELCWATKGPRWGPAGKGDTSGGCRCRVNNKLCTPTCQNCH